MDSFFAGLLAGFGIAIPPGAVSVLIMTTGMRQGFQRGFMAGAGAATADLIYATAASLAGTALVALLLPISRPLRIVGGAVLLGLAAYGLCRGLRKPGSAASAVPRVGSIAIYAQLLGITLINPLTIVYFVALILGRNGSDASSLTGRVLFVLGAALGSLSWQTVLAGLGSILHDRLPPRVRVLATLLGNLIIAALGARILLPALPV